MRTENAVAPKTIYLKDYTPAPYLAKQVNLSFNLLPGKTIVTSSVDYVKNPAGVSSDLVLDGEDQTVISVALNGQPFEDYTIADGQMTIVNPGHAFSLTIVSEIHPEANTALEGLYQSQGNYCTQCEAEGFRRITYYQDRPDVLSVFTVRIEADALAYPVMLSNGNLQEEGMLADGRHFRVWHDPFPKPCYLFALVAGDLERVADTFTTMTGRKVDLHIYVRAGDEGQCSHAMASLKKSMQWDEEVYGREYQLDLFNIVAVSDFNMGAMENTSLNVFNTALVLAHQETATDSDFMSVEGVIGHEYFHNWTGNRVTCRDWFQLSLKEGFTVFRDQEFSADMNSRAVLRIDDVNTLRRLQFSEDGSPLAHAVQPDQFIEISNFYTKTIYDKGAELIRMQHTLLGAETFRKATDLYFDRFDGQAVTCDDFVQCMADASGRDLSQFFRWYKQAGTPSLQVSSHYDASHQRYTLTFKQSQPDTPEQTNKQPLHIPVAVGLLDAFGQELLPTRVLEVTEREQTFTFADMADRPVPSILRGFSAPVKLETDLSDDDLRLLQVYDTDGFNKWEAGQTLALRTIQRVMDQPEADITQFVADIGTLIAQGLSGQGDKALLARALSLPLLGVIAQHQAVIDPAAIDAARTAILIQIKRTHKEALAALYDLNRNSGEFSMTPEAMGRRALQHAVLEILTVTNGTGCAARSKAHYDAADNMTDRVTALACLADSDQPQRAEVFADFYARFKNYPLVVDKWFSLQAIANREQIFEDLAMLRNHADFNIKNPNRVRSLYSAFAINNPVKFHDPSGKGYAFLRDVIIELNTINPQIAARMVTPLREWKRYTPALQAQMQAALEAILATPNLSGDVFEIVSKSLKG
ncbi:aminopeptidase N [Methylophilus medardicus]|uniref:Aminopeptidase N n=1 Tax=Methylophilus medardicus TaxID=2588534 RepID=A0A5B8CUB2_9PROT|nr:aminopeptidase N [Methylophilus medardicus]QDC44904.1 aminopeptidase N [Methylophilus medardicus]QDC49911.1 aminopeptidase N [Methylophilus medardicus]QDC53616.1 aminopeptidase N [Methylophilus medardicus]